MSCSPDFGKRWVSGRDSFPNEGPDRVVVPVADVEQARATIEDASTLQVTKVA